MLAAIQNEFAAALLDADRPVPHPVRSHTARAPAKRFAVYRNNVVVGLVNALRARFPATAKIVGEEFFTAMARVFVTAHPPRSPLLMHYGDDLPHFITAFAPAAELRYLPDVARLEAARTRAYHAADADAVDPAPLRGRDPQALWGARAILHPSAQILRSPHPIVTVWAMNAGEVELGPIDEDDAEDALVMRPQLDVVVRKLPPGGAAFLQALAAGPALGESAEIAAAADQRFDLAANLAGLIGSGVLVGLSLSEADRNSRR